VAADNAACKERVETGAPHRSLPQGSLHSSGAAGVGLGGVLWFHSLAEMASGASANLVIKAAESEGGETSGVQCAPARIGAAAVGVAAAGMAPEPVGAATAGAAAGVVTRHCEAGSAEPFSGLWDRSRARHPAMASPRLF
jgi:hypothetical protein